MHTQHGDSLDLDELQALLDRSIGGAGGHMRSIISPGERTLTAQQLTNALQGICHLAVATVTSKGEPRVSAADGHFIGGKFYWGTASSALKIKHLRKRPALSAAHLRGDDLGVFVHGTAHLIEAGDPWFDRMIDHWLTVYGADPGDDGNTELTFVRIDPHWMVAYSPNPAQFA